MPQDVPTAQTLLVREEKEARAAGKRPACCHEVPHPLPARRDCEYPEVRDAEVRLVEPPPPYLPVAHELAEKARLSESLPRDRHRAPVGFEEEERMPPVPRLSLEAQAEDFIRLDPQAVELAPLTDLDL